MNKTVSKLTVFFETPFWVGVLEREENGLYEACKITFFSEPKDCEIYDFMQRNGYRLQFSPPVKASSRPGKCVSPKRMQREIKKQLQANGIGAKAQQALKLQQEQNKLNRKADGRQQQKEEKDRRFELHRQKRKEKHRGH